ncbi:MAG: HAD family hydrolase [Aggregatilineales bacterium]
MTDLKVVLFDMDDTLIDWEHFHGDWRKLELTHLRGVVDFLADSGVELVETFETFCNQFGDYTQDAWLDARTSLRAPHLGKILMQTLRDNGIDASETITEAACLDAYGWSTLPGVTVFPDVPEVLKILHENDVRVGIVTNAFQPMRLRWRELDLYDLTPLFPERDLCVAAADVGYLKPHKRIFEHMLDKLPGVKPEEIVFVGDNPAADVVGSQDMGMKAVLRVRDSGSQRLQHIADPDATVTTLHEMLPSLDTWYPGWR